MTLRKDEYMIKGDSIIIPKKTLERLRKHYDKKAGEYDIFSFMMVGYDVSPVYYTGKTDILTDLLKLFEPLEG